MITDLEVTVSLYLLAEEVEANVTYTLCGQYYPATETTPEDFPEVTVLSVVLNDGMDISLVLERPEMLEYITEMVIKQIPN